MTRNGYLILEATIVVAVLAFVMVPMAAMMGLVMKANANSEATAVSAQLSVRLLEEIGLRKWDQKTPTPPAYIKKPSNTLGTDPGENPADKRTFNDIDDFNGWTESPPLDPVMRPLTQFSDYTSSVTVRYVNTTTLASVSGGTTDFKQVTVCTWRRGRKSICLDTIFSNR